MNIEEAHDLCISQPYATEDMPFGDDAIAFRVGGKIFALMMLMRNEQLSLKCAPELSEELRASHISIQPAWHLNKRHWIQIDLKGSDINKALVTQLIEHAHNLVLHKLNKYQLAELYKMKR